MKLLFTSNVKEFSRKIEKRLTKISEKEANQLLNELAMEFLRLVMRLTPVDTGRARAGWYPAAQRLYVPFAGENKGEGGIVIEEDLIEITNRVRYIMKLEYGSSRQAPEGMVRVALQELRRLVNKL